MDKLRLFSAIAVVFAAVALAQTAVDPQALWGPWEPCTVLIGNERDGFNDSVPARRMMTLPEAGNGNCALPFISKAPDEDRHLLLLTCGYPKTKGILLESTDECESWHRRRDYEGMDPDGWGLSCVGNGVILASDGHYRSADNGRTWATHGFPKDPRFDAIIAGWDPVLVDPNSNGRHLYLTTHFGKNFIYMEHKQMPLLSESFDAGATWTPYRGIPEFEGCNEVALAYNAKGEIVAAMRATTLMSPANDQFDHLEYSWSADGGQTWMPPKVVAGNGRHHPSMALLPDGRMVMTYVVRQGYADEDGKFAYGIEAVVSDDGGHTWDTDHRYLLARWTSDCLVTDDSGRRIQMERYHAGPQCTSTHYLPNSKCLVTAYGTNQNLNRKKGNWGLPRQVAMVKWRLADSYSGVKTPPPPPIPAEEALRRVRSNSYWSINYNAANGLPDCGWRSSYPPQAVGVHDGWLRIDHRATEACYSARGIDHLEMCRGPVGLRMTLKIPSCDDNPRPNCFIIYAVIGDGQDKYSFWLKVGKDGGIDGEPFGKIAATIKPDTPFCLEMHLDPISRCLRLWLDGTLVADLKDAVKFMAPETPSVFYFGSYSPSVGGLIDIRELKFGQLH